MIRTDIVVATVLLLIASAVAVALWRRARALEERLEAANRIAATLEKERTEAYMTQSNAVSALAHDFRQPIHIAQLYLHNIRHQLANDRNPNDVLQKLAQVEVLMRNTHQLVDDVVKTNRLESGASLVQRTKVNLTALCSDLAYNTQELAGHEALRINYYQSSPKPIWIYSDRGLLERLLRNLIVNAHKHAKARHIRIRVWENVKRIAISIADDGDGIPADRLSRVRQILTTTRDTATIAERKGFGFGLHNTRKIAVLIGGSVRVTSLKDRGTGFMLSLSAAIKVPEQDISDVPSMSVNPTGQLVVCIGPMPDEVRRMLANIPARAVYTESIPAVAGQLAEMRLAPTLVVVAESAAKHQNIHEDLENEFADEIPIMVIQSSRDAVTYPWPHLVLKGSHGAISEQLREALQFGGPR